MRQTLTGTERYMIRLFVEHACKLRADGMLMHRKTAPDVWVNPIAWAVWQGRRTGLSAHSEGDTAKLMMMPINSFARDVWDLMSDLTIAVRTRRLDPAVFNKYLNECVSLVRITRKVHKCDAQKMRHS